MQGGGLRANPQVITGRGKIWADTQLLATWRMKSVREKEPARPLGTSTGNAIKESLIGLAWEKCSD